MVSLIYSSLSLFLFAGCFISQTFSQTSTFPSSCTYYFSSPPFDSCVNPLVPLVGLERGRDLCFAQCVVCTQNDFISWFLGQTTCVPGSLQSSSAIINSVADAFLNTSALHGQFFLDDAGDIEENATQAVQYLFNGMPRRDLLLFESTTQFFMEFLIEHIRYALHSRRWSSSFNISWEIFADNVLPYAVLDEKRDLNFRWRPRFARLFNDVTSGASSITEAMQNLAAAIPRAASLGLLALSNSNGEVDFIPGPPISWRSSVSPAFISVEQVASFSGSCTGTGIVMVAAARSVGIPARLAGCGETIVRHDDHHWAEFYDPATPGPFGDFWHTKEGTSLGNEGGPFDAPSGPMLGCLQGVVPYSAIDSLWAASWNSKTYMPMLWSNDTWAMTWSFVGGHDRCGAYCQAWGCGVNNSIHYNQTECSQFTLL
jgi:hypothetical protein